MERLVIQGGHRLEGTVQICGAKNAALPQLAATLLSDEPLTLTNVPDLADIRSMLTLMEHYGVTVQGPAHATVTLDASGARNLESECCSASCTICSAVICTGAADLFFTLPAIGMVGSGIKSKCLCVHLCLVAIVSHRPGSQSLTVADTCSVLAWEQMGVKH